ncbi:MAG TPA: MerR family transcriptional regulator [Abditibacteriaceae bacterium]|jgi:DNA-binding transcriptional MerR regulator
MNSLQEVRDDRTVFSLEEFVAVLNELLPRHLPEGRGDDRVRDLVNIRLVRYFATTGLLDEPLKQGREARYTYRHLLQLLVIRRLMAMGHTTSTVKQMTAGRDDAQLEALLHGEAHFAIESRAPSDRPHSDRLVSSPSMQSPMTSAPDWDEPEAEADEAMERAEESVLSEAMEQSEPAPNKALDFLKKIQERQGPSSHSRRAPHRTTGPSAGSGTSGPLPLKRWVRLEMAPGLEVHLREDYELPPSSFERDRLMAAILDEIKARRKPRR